MKILTLTVSLVLLSFALAQKPEASGEEESIRRVHAEFVAFWDQADAKGLASLFTKDGDLVIPAGMVLSGRPAIQSFYESVFAQGYRGSRGGFTIRRARIKGETAIVDGSWNISGAKDATGALRRPEQGLYTAFLIKHGDKWTLAALREMVPAKE